MKKSMRNRRSLLPFIFSILLCSCNPEAPKTTEIPIVKIMTVQKEIRENIRTFSAVIQSANESKLSFRISGNLTRLHVALGDHVQKGQLIAELDPRDYELKVEQAKAELIQAQAISKKNKADYQRIRELYEANSASHAELDAARGQFDSSEASVSAKQKAYEQVVLQLGHTKLIAPSSGDITQIFASPNENVTPGGNIVRLSSTDKFQMIVSIPEAYIGLVTKDQKVNILIPALDNLQTTGVVTEIGVADLTVTTFPVTVKVLGDTSKIHSGMSAEAIFTFIMAVKEDVFYIPPSVVMEDDGKNYVYVVSDTKNRQGIVHLRAVTINAITNKGLEITEGLNDRDSVVIAGIHLLKDGMEVKVLENRVGDNEFSY